MTDYLYKCVRCKRVMTKSKKMEDAEKTEYCPFCGMPMNRLYTPPIVWGTTTVKEQKSSNWLPEEENDTSK